MASFMPNEDRVTFDQIPEVIVYQILTFLDSAALAFSASPTCFFFHVLSRYLQIKTPMWRTLHLLPNRKGADLPERDYSSYRATNPPRLSRDADTIPSLARVVQNRTCSNITLSIVFTTSGKTFKDLDLASVLPKNAVAIGCESSTTATVSNLSAFPDEFVGPVENDGDVRHPNQETLGSVTFANIPESTLTVFEIPTATFRNGSADDCMQKMPVCPLESGWSVVILMAPRTVNPNVLSDYIAKVHEQNKNVEIIGGIHMSSSSFIHKDGVSANKNSVVGVCVAGNVVYSSQISRACRPLGGLCEVTDSMSDEGWGAIAKVKRAEGGGGKEEPVENVAREAVMEMRARRTNALFCGVTDSMNKGFELLNIQGIEAGALTLDGPAKVGSKMHFFTLDAESSQEDLLGRLEAARKAVEKTGKEALGSILISCGGRGTGFYGENNVESSIFSKQLPGVGMSGFFSGGEIGPQARAMMPYQSTFRGPTELQGFTSVFGVFYVPKFLTPTAHVWEAAIRDRTVNFA